MECEDQNSVVSSENTQEESQDQSKTKRKKKRGIVYVAQIPKYMNVALIREELSKYGEVGRVYLQLHNNTESTTNGDTKPKKKKKEASRHFTEGWVEFESKKVAKFVAATLNNTQISTRKRSKFYDVLWAIKYLPRFKWTHLNERLAYERAVHKQRMKTEIAQAKREVNFFSSNVDRSKKLRVKQQQGQVSTFVPPEVKQRDTDMEIRQSKNQTTDTNTRTDFLKSLFS